MDMPKIRPLGEWLMPVSCVYADHVSTPLHVSGMMAEGPTSRGLVNVTQSQRKRRFKLLVKREHNSNNNQERSLSYWQGYHYSSGK